MIVFVMNRRHTWLVLVGTILVVSLAASCGSGIGGPAADFAAYGFRGVPAGAIVGSDGTLMDTWQGSRDIDEIKAVLDGLLSMSDEAMGRVSPS